MNRPGTINRLTGATLAATAAGISIGFAPFATPRAAAVPCAEWQQMHPGWPCVDTPSLPPTPPPGPPTPAPLPAPAMPGQPPINSGGGSRAGALTPPPLPSGNGAPIVAVPGTPSPGDRATAPAPIRAEPPADAQPPSPVPPPEHPAATPSPAAIVPDPPPPSPAPEQLPPTTDAGHGNDGRIPLLLLAGAAAFAAGGMRPRGLRPSRLLNVTQVRADSESGPGLVTSGQPAHTYTGVDGNGNHSQVTVPATPDTVTTFAPQQSTPTTSSGPGLLTSGQPEHTYTGVDGNGNHSQVTVPATPDTVTTFSPGSEDEDPWAGRAATGAAAGTQEFGTRMVETVDPSGKHAWVPATAEEAERMGTVFKGLGRAGFGVGLGLSVYDGVSGYQNGTYDGGEAGAVIGGEVVGGALGGALAGAAVGSMAGPVGTAIGAGIGAAIGSEVGKNAALGVKHFLFDR
ncbi:hypothetical protein ACIA8C_07420 [Nocardia sp. NPDC051321]|uniref:hypothetical protein n=1 Tax=Nocardia sp. NPDC051321 TaxID=3364323 RepID=UPI0037904191